jgi:hypothetical protein
MTAPRPRLDRERLEAAQPAALSGPLGRDAEVEQEIEEIVRVLSDRGPLKRGELHSSLQSRVQGTDQFEQALRLAVSRGLVLHQGARYASAMGEG